MTQGPVSGANFKWLEYWWPTIHDIETAKDAALTGVHAAFFVSIATFVLVLLSVFHILNWGDSSALLDAIAFAVLGLLIRRMSRIAAILALGLFILERAYEGYATGLTSAVGFIAALCLMGFTSGVRGTFAYHRFKKQPG